MIEELRLILAMIQIQTLNRFSFFFLLFSIEWIMFLISNYGF